MEPDCSFGLANLGSARIIGECEREFYGWFAYAIGIKKVVLTSCTILVRLMIIGFMGMGFLICWGIFPLIGNEILRIFVYTNTNIFKSLLLLVG